MIIYGVRSQHHRSWIMVKMGEGWRILLGSGHVPMVEACTVSSLCGNSAGWIPVMWTLFLIYVAVVQTLLLLKNVFGEIFLLLFLWHLWSKSIRRVYAIPWRHHGLSESNWWQVNEDTNNLRSGGRQAYWWLCGSEKLFNPNLIFLLSAVELIVTAGDNSRTWVGIKQGSPLVVVGGLLARNKAWVSQIIERAFLSPLSLWLHPFWIIEMLWLPTWQSEYS